MKSLEEKLIRALLRRMNAKNALLAAYRLQRPPSEAAWRELEATEDAEAKAREYLERAGKRMTTTASPEAGGE